MTKTIQNQNTPVRRKLSQDVLEELGMLDALARRAVESVVPVSQK